jgi:hypothetical protein
MIDDPGNPENRLRPAGHDDCFERVGQNHCQETAAGNCRKNSHHSSIPLRPLPNLDMTGAIRGHRNMAADGHAGPSRRTRKI